MKWSLSAKGNLLLFQSIKIEPIKGKIKQNNLHECMHVGTHTNTCENSNVDSHTPL